MRKLAEVMARRLTVRSADVKAIIRAFQATGLTPMSLRLEPDGTMTWRFYADGDPVQVGAQNGQDEENDIRL